MHGIITWLFTDPQTAGLNTASTKPEVFHFYLPWIIFCALGLILPFYYAMEGRKRFFGHHALNKFIMDRITNQLWPLALVGFILMGMRYAMDSTLFAWRFWRYGWALWCLGLAIYWIYYFGFRYANDRAWYKNKRTLEKYYPQPRGKRRTAKAGSR
jgi:hypothetical protein